MSTSQRNIVIVVLGLVVLVVAVLLATREPEASNPPGATPSPSASASAGAPESTGPSAEPSPGASDEPSQEPVALTVGLGFIPSVQFAPFYLADQAGYYTEAGVDVEFQNKIDPDARHARRAGLHRRRAGRWHERHPGRQPGHPDQVRGHDLRPVPVDRVREGIDRDQDGGRPRRARRSGSRGDSARRGSCSRRCSPTPTSRPRTSRSSSTRTSARVPRCPRGRSMPPPGSRTTSRSSWS